MSANTSSHSKHWITLVLSVLVMLGPFSIDTYLPAFGAIRHELGMSTQYIQQTLSVYLISYALGSLFYGAISDVYGRRPVILTGLVCFVLGSIVCACAPNAPTLLLGRMLQGLSVGAGLVVGRASIMDLFPRPEAQRILSHVAMIFAVAPAVAPILGGFMVTHGHWRYIFWFLAGAGVCTAFAVYKLFPESLSAQNRRSLQFRPMLRNYIHVLKNRRFLCLALTVALNFSALFLYITSTPVLMLELLGRTEQEFAYFFVPCVLGLILGSWYSGRMVYQPQKLLRRGFLVVISACLANLFLSVLVHKGTPQIVWVVAPLALYAIGFQMLSPALTVIALECFPDHRGSASSIHGFVGTALSGITAGFLSPVFAQSIPLLALGHTILVTLALLCFYLGQKGSATLLEQ